MSRLDEFKLKMAELRVEAKRSLGQNFLINEAVIGKIVERVRRAPSTHVLEIGPGLGALTEPLVELKRPLVLIELDRRLAEYWRTRGFSVVEDDALKVQWERQVQGLVTTLVSNLPYQISTHLVVDRCFGPKGLDHMVLMFQKEVAQRFMAEPRTKAYGLLSVMAQTFFRMEKVADAGPKDFFPAPQVASRVLEFHRLPCSLDRDFLEFVKAAFAFRRKFLLKGLAQGHKRFAFTMEELESALRDVGHKPQARAEELSPAQFVELFGRLKQER